MTFYERIHNEELPSGDGGGVVVGEVVGAVVVQGKVLHATFSVSTSPSHVLHLSEKPPPHGCEHIV